MSEIYRFAGLELDTSRFQVRRAGQVLAVQPQVFDVRHYLGLHFLRTGRVDEAERLLDGVLAADPGRVPAQLACGHQATWIVDESAAAALGT